MQKTVTYSLFNNAVNLASGKACPALNPNEGVYINPTFKSRIIAGVWNGYLVWPGTLIPFLDQERLKNHPQRHYIENKIEAAIDNPERSQALWLDEKILSLALREAL